MLRVNELCVKFIIYYAIKLDAKNKSANCKNDTESQR